MIRSLVHRTVALLPPGTRRRLARRLPARLLAAYRTRTTDVYLISYPKCGRTWLRLMLGRALAGHLGVAPDNLLDLAAFARLAPGAPSIRVTHDDEPHTRRPGELERDKSRYRHGRVLLLVRDPRDVIVSLYFQRTRRDGTYTGSLEAFVEEERGGFETILAFYRIWSLNRHVPRDFLLMRYEEMREDPGRQLRRALAFLGVDGVADEIVEEAVRYTSFESMRRLEASGRLDGRLRPGHPRDPDSYKTRRGKVGGYRDTLEPEQIAALDRMMAACPAGSLGYRPESSR